MAEIDKYAIKSYEAIHGATPNFGDISKIEKLPKADFWTYSFPCQDLSVAGKQKGLGEGTRSGLLYEVERLLEVSKEHGELPTYLMLENVKNLVGKKFKGDFDRWIGKLNQLGYNTYWQILNAKHYGVPQNRERVFAISILREFDMGYAFPEGFDNGVRLKDILEDEVDEKFYISNEKVEKLALQMKDKNSLMFDASQSGREEHLREYNDFSPTLTAREHKEPRLINDARVEQVGNIVDTGNWGNPQRGRIYSSSGCSPALNCCGGGGLEPKVLIPQATTKGYIECSVPGVFDMTYPDSKTRRGRVQDHGEIVPTLTAASQDIMYVEPKIIDDMYKNRESREYAKESPTLRSERVGLKVDNGYRIRKLTPKECFRLMGFTDEQFHKAESVNSNSQLYKQAGNSIVVDVLYYLFENLFLESDNEKLERQVTIFDLGVI